MHIKLFRLFACLALAGRPELIAAGQSSNQAPRKGPLAVVAGQPVYDEDLSASAQGQLRQLIMRQYEERAHAVEQIVEQQLLEAKARSRAVSVEVLLKQDVDSRIPEPSTAELKAYYLGLKDRLDRPFAEVKAELLEGLKRAKIQEARQEYLKDLWERNGVVILVRAPKVEVAGDSERLRGNPEAPIAIVEFSDFQCPFCRKIQPVLRNLLSKHAGHVSLSFRDFPLREIHPGAQLAAEAARCAGEQSRFWEYHDLLFADANLLDRKSLIERAGTLKLDEGRFDSCLNSGKYRPLIEKDVQDGLRAGVSGTPGFFINGVPLTGFHPEAVLEKIIQQQLALSQVRPEK